MTNWRAISDVTGKIWADTLVAAQSPIFDEFDEAYDAAQPHTALCLAMLDVESKFGTAFNANDPAKLNYLNLRDPKTGVFMTFPSAVDGIRAWKDRITSQTYKTGIYARTKTIEELVHVYAPSTDNNNESEYVRLIEADLARWGIKGAEPMTKYKIVGLPGDGIELPVLLSHDIIPKSQTKQRPGIARQLPGFWVQHETGNPSPGADAAMHNRYLHNGAEGQTLSYHFTVDDHSIYQMIPIDEVTWQAADGGGPGNMSGVSCELCINRGIDTAKARHNAEALCGGILKALGMAPALIKRHWDFNAGSGDRHHCPDQMMTQGYWPTFVANATKIITGNITTPVFATPAPITWQEGDIGVHDLNGTPALAFLLQVKVTVGKVVPQVSETDKTQAGPLRKKNTLLTAIGVYRDAQRRPFVVLRDKTRVPYKSVRPLVPLPPIAA